MQSFSQELVGVGVDIVERERVQKIRFLSRFAEYFLTPDELASFRKNIDPIAFIASRFALKEATIKAFPGFLKPHDFEIIKNGKKPAIRFCASDTEENYRVFASISHSTEYAAGYALIVKK